MSALVRRVEPHEMGTGRVFPVLVRMALPMILSGLLSTTYQLVDMLFISWLGRDQVTGVGAAFPVMFFIFAIGQAAAIGAGITVSRRLGEKRTLEARHSLEQALLASVLVGGIFSLLAPFVAGPLMSMLGAEGNVHSMGVLYLERILLGVVVFHLMLTADSGLRSQGNTMTGMKIALLINFINLALDGFFIFGPNNLPVRMPQVWPLENLAQLYVAFGLDHGVQGGATTSVLAHALGAGMMLIALRHPRTAVRPFISLRDGLRLRPRLLGTLYLLGLPATVSIIGMSASGMIINRILFGLNEAAVGVLMIANRIEMLAFVPIFCIGAATIPLCGYNLGAGRIDRCRSVIVSGALTASGLMGLAGLVLFLFPGVFLSAFTSDPELLAMGSRFLRINSLSYFIIGVDVVLSNAFQGLGRPELSTLVQLVRTLIVKVPMALLLASLFGVGGVWWSFPISSFACFLVASLLMWRLLQRLALRTFPQAASGPELHLAEAADEAQPILRDGGD